MMADRHVIAAACMVWTGESHPVLMQMAEMANDETELAFPTIETLMIRTNATRRVVLRAVAMLRDWGYLVDTGKRCGYTNRTIVYRVAIPPRKATRAAMEIFVKNRHAELMQRKNGLDSEDESENDAPANKTDGHSADSVQPGETGADSTPFNRPNGCNFDAETGAKTGGEIGADLHLRTKEGKNIKEKVVVNGTPHHLSRTRADARYAPTVTAGDEEKNDEFEIGKTPQPVASKEAIALMRAAVQHTARKVKP